MLWCLRGAFDSKGGGWGLNGFETDPNDVSLLARALRAPSVYSTRVGETCSTPTPHSTPPPAPHDSPKSWTSRVPRSPGLPPFALPAFL